MVRGTLFGWRVVHDELLAFFRRHAVIIRSLRLYSIIAPKHVPLTSKVWSPNNVQPFSLLSHY